MTTAKWNLMILAAVLTLTVGIVYAQPPAPGATAAPPPPPPPQNLNGPPPGAPGMPPPGPEAGMRPMLPPDHAPGGPPAPPQEITEENRKMLQQVMVSRLSMDLGLTDEQSIIFMRRFAELEEQQRALRRERAEIMRKLRPILKDQRDEDALHRLMGRLEDINRKSAASEETIRRSFDEMNLNVWQKAKVELFLSDFENQVRRIIQQARNGGLNNENIAPGHSQPLPDMNKPLPQRPNRTPRNAPHPPIPPNPMPPAP